MQRPVEANEEPAQNGRGVERAPRKAEDSSSRFGARVPGLCGLEEKLNYRFRNRGLLIRALTHRSAADRAPAIEEQGSPLAGDADNEQLEFLGDSILGFIVSEALVSKHPSVREGQLSQWKAHLVSASHLYECALELELGQHLLLGKGEERNGGRERRTLLANAVEAVIAAIYLDGGVAAARSFIEARVLSVLESPDDVESIGLLNHKSVLQERTQAMGLPVPRYSTVATSGPEHAKIFTVEARVGSDFFSRANGSSKKAASQQAAQLLLERLDAGSEPKPSGNGDANAKRQSAGGVVQQVENLG